MWLLKWGKASKLTILFASTRSCERYRIDETKATESRKKMSDQVRMISIQCSTLKSVVLTLSCFKFSPGNVSRLEARRLKRRDLTRSFLVLSQNICRFRVLPKQCVPIVLSCVPSRPVNVYLFSLPSVCREFRVRLVFLVSCSSTDPSTLSPLGFNSGNFFRHPLLQQFKFYWRIEPDGSSFLRTRLRVECIRTLTPTVGLPVLQFSSSATSIPIPSSRCKVSIRRSISSSRAERG